MYMDDDYIGGSTTGTRLKNNTGTINPDDGYNVYGSKLEDIQEINRLKDENLTLKLIIGEMQLDIFKLHKKLDEKD